MLSPIEHFLPLSIFDAIPQELRNKLSIFLDERFLTPPDFDLQIKGTGTSLDKHLSNVIYDLR